MEVSSGSILALCSVRRTDSFGGDGVYCAPRKHSVDSVSTTKLNRILYEAPRSKDKGLLAFLERAMVLTA
jgi:hypothetical protein